jgi:hypothetical protein
MTPKLIAVFALWLSACFAAAVNEWVLNHAYGTVNYLDLTFDDGSLTTIDTSMNFAPHTWLGLNQGRWSPTYHNQDEQSNNLTGNWEGHNFRSFFTFDLTALDPSNPVAHASFRLGSTHGVSRGGPFDLFDVSTEVTVLNVNDRPSREIFIDLGTGMTYGSTYIRAEDAYVEDWIIDLNATAVGDINLVVGSGYFSIGGKHIELVPEPASVVVLALSAFLFWRKSHK